jgi:hypothetical protein
MCLPLKTNVRSPSMRSPVSSMELGFGFDRRHIICLHLPAGLLFCLWFVSAAFGFPPRAQSNDTQARASSITGNVNVTTGQGQTSKLAGVAVKVNDPNTGVELQSTLTDENGHYLFTQLPAGMYVLEVQKEGFKGWSKNLTLDQGQTATEDVNLEINAVDQQIEVRGEAIEVSTQSAQASVKLDNRDLDTLPLAQQKFTDALPLTPGVVRTAEGKLNFNGQAESQGTLLVNSTENVDPVTGSFAIPVPVDVIQNMNVHSTPDSAEYGGFSGGMTQIEINPPPDAWNFRLHDFLPGTRGKNGHMVGVADFTPRLVFGGPLIKDKVNFTEELAYEVRNQPVRGLSWPVNETKTRSMTSFTELQAILSRSNILDVNINVFPLRRQFADISALVPQSASSDYGQNGVSVGISDNLQLSAGGLLILAFRYTRFDSHGHGQGPEDMQITPEGWGGNFFNSWSRVGDEVEFRPAFQLAEKSWHGLHELKIGVDVSRRSYEGSSSSHPVELLRQDGSMTEQISFQGQGQLDGASTEAGEFIEDHWILDPHLALDMGARLSSQSIGRSAALGPHIGVAYSPRRNGKTVIRVGAGTVYGHVPLLAADFINNPTRVITFFDPSGTMIGGPVLLQNTYLQSVAVSGAQLSSQTPRTSPRNFTWSFEVEREISQAVSLKVSYIDSQTRNLFVVDPLFSASGGDSMLALANTGASRYRRVEATIHAQPSEHDELNVSYIWSRARGDLNTLADIYVPFEMPVIRPNASGILPSDVPERVVGWGIFKIPWKLTVSPVIDVHAGLPYSNVDALQNYVGTPNSLRFPVFFSLDGRVYREFSLRLPFKGRPTNRKFRLGLYSFNLTNHQNPLVVYSNIASPMFGQFAGFQHRVNGFVLDMIN